MSEPRHGADQEDLQRSLNARHVLLIAVGGVIGVGMFLGANSSIKTAGPAFLSPILLARFSGMW